MAGSGTRCQRWIAPTNAEYRQGARSTELNHSRSRATWWWEAFGHRRGPLDPESRAWHVRESFAVLRSASSENDSTATVSAEGDELGSPQHPRARNISWAWAPLSGESDCRRRRSDNSASIRPVPLRGRRRIILTAGAPQSGKTLPHVPSPALRIERAPSVTGMLPTTRVALDLLSSVP